MTFDRYHLALFASTVAGGLGMALIANSVVVQETPTIAGTIGAAIMVAAVTAFLWAARVGKHALTVRTTVAAVAMGGMALWFWLVPGRTAFVTAACEADQLGACEEAAKLGGLPQRIAYDNEHWIENKCLSGEAKYCRIAAAKRLIHPAHFCWMIPLEDEFEVVEWCTRGVEFPGQLTARR